MKRLAFLALFLCGCQSYDIVQTNVFSDDDGNVLRVDYGRAAKPHKNTFLNPANGKEMDFLSTLVIDATLPDGKEITAWQCMNFQPSGTMYMTDDKEWMVHANGFSTMVYRQLENDETRYAEVYRGILCESPKVDYEPNKKWRSMKKTAEGKWR